MVSRSTWQDVHLFVSSTFRDTQAERDVLVRRVFPVLRAELLPHKVRLIDIDLRWGIEGKDESGVVAVCMEVLEQALPRFIGIIGDRYGWIPPGSAVSVTEQEITTALRYENCHPLFLFRDPARPDGSASLDFLDDSDSGENALQKAKKLSLLRTRIVESSTARVHSYQCSIHEGTVVPDAAFETQALNGLRESLRSLYKTDDVPVEPTPSDTVGHALNFASERAAEWLGGLRDDELSHLTNFLKTNTGHVHILGDGGSGKTSLLAKTLDDILDESINDGRAVLAAFCGAHRGSESGEAVFRGFADRLVDTSIPASDDHDPSRPPSDFDGLRAWFARRITDTKAILLIDGIDQLPERDRFLTWLPNPVPDGVTVLTGSLDATSTTHLSEHWKARATDVITLPPLDNLSGAGFVTSQLTRYRKTLSEAALSALLAKPGASTPLYLRIAAEELRTKGVRENLESDISGMPGTAGGMFLWVLERLASDHQFRWSDGQSAVASLVGCLGIARDGLSEDELVAFLSAIDPDGHDPDGDTAVLLQLLRPYLGRRGDRYATLHRVFSEALHGLGLTDADRSLLGSEHPAPLDELSEVERAHAQLASLFAEMPADHFRRLSEEAWHRIHSGDFDGACSLLTDFSTLKSRVEAGLVRGVLEDMDALVGSASGADWPIPEELRVWQRLFRRRREFWEQFPDEFHQDCLNEADGLPTTESAKANPIDKPWIRWVNKPEHEISHPWEWMVRDASCAAFSPDGKTVAVAGTDGSLRLLEAETGYEAWKVTGRTLDVMETVVFNPDGTMLLTISKFQNSAQIWNTSDGTQTAILTGHAGKVRSAAFSPDGSHIVTASWDCTARVWEVKTGKTVHLLCGHEAYLLHISFSPDGSSILTASADRTARLWDRITGMDLQVFRGHSGSVKTAEFSPDGSLILTVGNDNTARIWCRHDGTEHACIGARLRNIKSAEFFPDGFRIFVTNYDKTAEIWDPTFTRQILKFEGHDGGLNSEIISPDGRYVLTASEDQTVRSWCAETGEMLNFAFGFSSGTYIVDLDSRSGSVLVLGESKNIYYCRTDFGKPAFERKGHVGSLTHIALNADGSRALTVSDDGTARIWNTSVGSQVSVIGGRVADVSSASFCANGSRVVTACTDNAVRIWDVETGAELLVLRGHDRWVYTAAFSPDGSRVLTTSYDKTARVWDTSTGVEMLVLGGDEHRVCSAVFSPSGKNVLTASGDNTARVWDASTGSLLLVLRGHESGVKSAIFSPDGSRVLTTSYDYTARIWDASTGAELFVLHGHSGPLESALLSPDGKCVLMTAWDGTVRIWDVSSSAELLVLRGHEAFVSSVVFSPDGSRILTASNDKTARVWDASSGAELLVLRGHESTVQSAVFSSDGSRVLTASEDKTARLWDQTTGDELVVFRKYYQGNNDTAGVYISSMKCVDLVRFSANGARLVVKSGNSVSLWNSATGTVERRFDDFDFLKFVTMSPNGAWVVTIPSVSDPWGNSWGLLNSVSRNKETVEARRPIHGIAFQPGTGLAITYGDDHVQVWESAVDSSSERHVPVLEDVSYQQGHDGLIPIGRYYPPAPPSTTETSGQSGNRFSGQALQVKHSEITSLSEIGCLFASPDGLRMLMEHSDNRAHLWDAQAGAALAVFDGYQGRVISVSMSPDGLRVLMGTGDRYTRIWDAKSGKLLCTKDGGHVESAVFSPDGSCVLAAGAGKTAVVWDSCTGNSLFVLRGHESRIRSAVFSPDGSRFLTASDDKTARIWDASTGEELWVLRGHESRIRSAMFSPDGSRVLTASTNTTRRIWDASTGEELWVLRGHEGFVSSAVFSPDGSRVMTASNDNTARIWDASTGEELLVLRGHEGFVSSAVFSPDGSRVLTTSDKWARFSTNTAQVWDASTGVELLKLMVHKSRIRSAVFSPNGLHVLTTSDDKIARIWDASTGAELAFLRGDSGWQWLAAGQTSRQLEDALTSGPSPAPFQMHSESVTGAVLSPTGERLLTWSKDRTARVWDLESGTERVALRGHSAAVTGGAFSEDGSQVATVSEDGSARVWDALTGRPLHTIDGLESGLIEVAFVNGDRTLLVRGTNREHLLDVATGSAVSEGRPITSMERPTLLIGKDLEIGLDVRGDASTGSGMECERCCGTGFVYPDDIERLGMQGHWWPGPCRLCGYRGHRTHLDSPTTADAFQIDPMDPLSFAAGCADGSVRFFHLEGVELPTTH